MPVTLNRTVEQSKATSPNNAHPTTKHSHSFLSQNTAEMLLFLILATLLASSAAQAYPECTAEVARSDDCAAVINANACYNKFRWNAQTLTCIDGNDNAVKQKKASSLAVDGEGIAVLTMTEHYRCALVAAASEKSCATGRRSRGIVEKLNILEPLSGVDTDKR
jgi:Ulp1 family protease